MSGGDANGDDGGTENGGRNGSDDGDRESDEEQNQGSSAAEKVLTGISIAFTVLLFSYVALQAVQPPDGTHPQAHVVGTDEASNGSVVVRVELTNAGNAGLISATVETDCERPPPDVTFEYVPAGDRERGTLVCPAGTTRPNVSVSSWVPT